MDTRDAMRAKLRIRAADVAAVSGFLTAPGNRLVDGLLDLIERYGGVDAINRHAAEAGRLETRLERLREERSPFLADLGWLAEERDAGRFVTLPEYRHGVLGADTTPVDEGNAVTLEISALQYFPWLIAEARQAIARRELMPAATSGCAHMREQSAPGEDILAVAAAMQVIGASHVETLDTRGTDGSNVHLGGPDTITGYFGGIGQPNDHALELGRRVPALSSPSSASAQVLNVNSGTILVALLMHKLGIENEFKVSVFMGVDNPWAVLWSAPGRAPSAARGRLDEHGGLNLSNSVEPPTLLEAAEVRARAWASTTTCAWSTTSPRPTGRSSASRTTGAPSCRPLAASVEHLGQARGRRTCGGGDAGAPERHRRLLRVQEQAVAGGLMPLLEANYLDKHAPVNRTAAAAGQGRDRPEGRRPAAPAVGERGTATA